MDSPAQDTTRTEDTEEWTSDQCAKAWGIKRRTWSGYVTRGYAPQPSRHVGRTPVWDAEKVRTWPRPGQGTRTTPDTTDAPDPGHTTD